MRTGRRRDRARAQQHRPHRIHPQLAACDDKQAGSHQRQAYLTDSPSAKANDKSAAPQGGDDRGDVLNEQIQPQPRPRNAKVLGDSVCEDWQRDLADIGERLL